MPYRYRGKIITQFEYYELTGLEKPHNYAELKAAQISEKVAEKAPAKKTVKKTVKKVTRKKKNA